MQERMAPPARWAASYVRRTFDPPPSNAAYRALPGVATYPPPPPGCYWASEVCWWTVRPGPVVLRVRRIGHEHNGHHFIRAAIVDLCLGEEEQVLEEVGLPSVSLTQDVEHMTGWTAVEVGRVGRRRPWQAAEIEDGPFAALAACLELEDDDADE
ncbi:hypothetical protein [Streptomyces sp. NPDC058157]|uniref:hypothetical protein n=1 Tax=Streptomyces sp. NPDC058157 TaxID=3346360 RepID=UPI0036E0165E